MLSTAVLAFTLASFLPAGPDTSSVGLAADLRVLERTYKALHPGLYRYNTTAQMDANFAELAHAWDHNQDLGSAYLALSEFEAKIKCGHTYANFFNQPKEVAAQLFDKPNKVPFTFRWLERHMVVTQDATPNHLFPPGTEILSINGVTCGRLLQKLLKVARADGSNDAKRVADMEILGDSKYEAFDVFFPLYFPPKSSDYVYKVLKPGSSQSDIIQATAVTANERNSRLTVLKDDPTAPVWALTFPKPNVAYLKMPTWEMYNRKWDWKGFLQSSFSALVDKGTPNLVIDLRGNEGGDSVGDYILPWLIKQPMATENYQRFTRYRKVPSDLRPYLSTWDPSFYDWGDSARPDPNGFFKLTRYDDGKGSMVSPNPRTYNGKVFVIVGPENSSATFEFAYQVQRLKLATLVGLPTGGSLRGINGGAFLFLTLPHSQIEVDVPLIAQFFPDKRPDRGLQPDVSVEPKANDIARGRDTELEKIFSIAP